jgi:hypothetical protein
MGRLKSLIKYLLDIKVNRTIHDLKTWPIYFEMMQKNLKNFEIRKNDRNFKVGDILRLKEWNPETKKYTGREMAVNVKYIFYGGEYGLDVDYVIMAIE